MKKSVKGKRANYHRNLVVKVRRYNLEKNVDGCYPGAVEGEVVGGPLHGKVMTVTINRTHSNEKVSRFHDMVNPDLKIHTPPDGYLAFSTVREEDNEFKANWVNKFAGPESDIRVNVPIQIAPTIELGGGFKRFKSNNATMFRAFILNTDKATSSEHPSDVQEAIKSCFKNDNAAFLRLVGSDESRETMVLWRGWKDCKPIPILEAASNALTGPILAKIEAFQKRGGTIDVVPLETMLVRPDIAESIDNGLFSSIAIRDYCTGGIGCRIEAALVESGNVLSELPDHFYDSLDQHAKGAFDEYGWPGIWTSDIEKFFRNLDIEPPKVPTYGYSLSTAVIKSYKSKNGQEKRFLTKTRSMGPTVSREFVATPSDSEATERYFAGFRDLVRQTITAIEKRKTWGREDREPDPIAPTEQPDHVPEGMKP